MTSGKEELDNPKPLIGYVEKEEKDAFAKIKNRDSKSYSQLVRMAVLEYTKIHGSGNDVYTLDDFSKSKNMIAIPALMTNREELMKYTNSEQSYEELQKVLDQLEFFQGLIKNKMLNKKLKSPEVIKAQKDRDDRFRRINDIRYKDPKKMRWPEQQHYHQIMSRYSDEERENFLKIGREMRNET